MKSVGPARHSTTRPDDMTSEYTISRRQSESLRVLRDSKYVLKPIPSPDGGEEEGVRTDGRRESRDDDDDDYDDDNQRNDDGRAPTVGVGRGGGGSQKKVSVSVDFDADGVEPSELRFSLARAATERRRESEGNREDEEDEEDEEDGFNARVQVFAPVHRVDVPLPVDPGEVSAFETAVEALKKGQLEVRKVGSTK